MSRPYEGKYPLPEVIEKIAPGSTQTAGFISERPMDEMGTLIRNGAGYWHLYVMGWVDYFDELGTRRRTAFCREFIPNKGRFFPVSDPDYEHEE